MRSVDELRAEARELRETAKNLSDPKMRRELAARSFDLAMRAAVIQKLMENPATVQAKIAHYWVMLDNENNTDQQEIIKELLAAIGV